MEEINRRPKLNTLVIIVIGVVLGIILRTCSDNPPNYVTPKTAKEVIKEIEEKTVYLKGDVRYLKQVVKTEDLVKVDSLKRILDSIAKTKSPSEKKDSGLNDCLNVVSAQDTLIARQDTIILKQDSIIYNDSIVKVLLNQEVKYQKKKARKNMVKGTVFGFIGGIITGILVKNT
jgi:hypothetical protein